MVVEGIIVVDSKGEIVYFNQRFSEIFRVPFRKIKSLNYEGLFSCINLPRNLAMNEIYKISKSKLKSKGSESEWIYPEDGRIYETMLQINRDKGRFIGFILFFQEKNSLKGNHLKEGDYQIQDPLSGLYNRPYFNRRFVQELSRAKKMDYPLAILRCDLDQFKKINEHIGQEGGDDVLRNLASKIQCSIRGIDLVFRWGGDEFMVILKKSKREGALKVADRLTAETKSIGDAAHVNLELSVGIALFPEHGEDTGGLIQMAERALEIAKKSGDKIHVAVEEYPLGRDSIKVVFQPIFDIFMKDGAQQILGYEALGRDPNHKFSILEFFQKYQAIGQLNELKCICFRSQLDIAKNLGLNRVFINVDFKVLQRLGRVRKPSGLDVVLEISEMEAMHDIENHLKLVKKWREEGYHFAIDDFGAGFISLPFVSRACPEYIKMDRSTILQAVNSNHFKKILRDLVRVLGNYASQGIIAEGIENQKELKVVKEIGIYLVQGFLLGKPKDMTNNPENT